MTLQKLLRAQRSGGPEFINVTVTEETNNVTFEGFRIEYIDKLILPVADLDLFKLGRKYSGAK